MENNYNDERNSISAGYRGYKSSSIPFQVEKHLEFIEISEEGYVLLGSSNLNGRYCTGSVWYFMDAEDTPDREKCLTGVDCPSSVSVGKFLDSKQKIVVGEDSGAVTVYTLTELEEDHSFHLIGESSRNDHDDCVLSISVSNDKTKVVTGSMDMSIKIWNTEEWMNEQNFRYSHYDHVTCVDFHPEDSNHIFASCSLDGALLLWDLRQQKHATALRDTPEEGLTALAWKNLDNNVLAVGSVLGNISMLDIRTGSTFVDTRPFRRSIHKLLFLSSNWMAATADSHVVKVLDSGSQSLKELYADETHNDFVRGLAWHSEKQSLFSCGWDKQVLQHSITALKSNS